MCRSIKQLRQPGSLPPADDVHAAALQYVRKVSGFRVPSRANREAFDAAVAEVAAATAHLLAQIGDRTAAEVDRRPAEDVAA